MVENKKTELPTKLRAILKNLPRIALAFSGGVDSRFLAHAAKLCGCAVLAINARGPHIAPDDTNYARHWAKKRRLKLECLDYDPLDLPEVRTNSRERCYGCKKGLIARIASRVAPGWAICDGANADDQKVFRPGNRAAKEAGIISPLALSGLTKQDIRLLAARTGMDNPGQPSRPCLLTRLDYGYAPERGILRALAACESELGDLFSSSGYADIDFRIRLRPQSTLQTSRMIPNLEAAASKIMSKFGFAPAQILTSAQISGFFDKPDTVKLH